MSTDAETTNEVPGEVFGEVFPEGALPNHQVYEHPLVKR